MLAPGAPIGDCCFWGGTMGIFARLLKLFAAVLAVSAMASANAATIQLRAWLNGAQVPLAVGGTGLGTVSYDTATKVLSWSVTYSGLSGPCTLAHFHGPASAGVNASPVVTMTCSASPLTGSSAALTPTQEAQLLSGQWYINIHTGANPGGEIRGQVVRVAYDFDGDGRADVLWRNNTSGQNYVYVMNGTSIASEGYLRTVADLNWEVWAIGDFNGDGKDDILWRNRTTGEGYIYLMDGTTIPGEGFIRTVADLNWGVHALGDFDGDGRTDIFWRNRTTGENYIYPMAGLAIKPTEGYVRTVADPNWQVVAFGDYNGDGRTDLIWRNSSTGENYLYPMDGTTILAGEGYLRTVADQAWKSAWPGGGGGGGPSLQLGFHFSGIFGGGTTGLITFPASVYYIANFNTGSDPNQPASVFFTGPAGSGLTNTESSARFLSGDGSAGYASPQRTEVPPGGAWTVNYKGQPINFTLADPDSTNRGIIVVPTVILNGDTVTEIQWQYKNSAGVVVSPPQSFVRNVDLNIDGLVSGQTVRLYDRNSMSFATTSHTLTSPVTWSAVTQIQLVVNDDRDNRYTSHWYNTPPPPPTISNLNPSAAPVGYAITITGTNFGCTGCVGGVNAVRFTGSGGSGESGVAAQFTIDSTTQITAT